MSFEISLLIIDWIAEIRLGLSWILQFLLRRSKRNLADGKLILFVSEVICEIRLRDWSGLAKGRILSEEAGMSLIGTNSHLVNWFFVSSRNKMTRPNEKISDFFSFFSKHSGLAKTGVPPFESESAIPKSVKTISIWVKSFGPFLNLTKKFCGFISLWVWSCRSNVSRLLKDFLWGKLSHGLIVTLPIDWGRGKSYRLRNISKRKVPFENFQVKRSIT